MKYLKELEVFEASKGLTTEQIRWLSKCSEGLWRFNASTGIGIYSFIEILTNEILLFRI